jgi:hypothetical protein
MTNEDHSTSGGKSFFSNHRSQIIVLGMIGFAVAAIALISPAFWMDHWIPILLIASGFGMPALFSLWNYWVEYGWQVGIAPGLAFALMGIFTWLFGYDADALWTNAVFNLFWTNLLVLAIWLILVLFAFRSRSKKENTKQDYRKGEVWRDYRWLAGSGILILLVLIDFSWGKSVLGVNALERRQSVEYVFSQSGAVLQVEYPEKILYDGENTGSLVLLLTTDAPCLPASITIASSDLLFAIPPSNDTPPQWTKTLTVPLQKDGKTLTILIRPAQPAPDFIKEALFTVQSPHTELALQSATPPVVKLEGRQDAQRRLWLGALMDTGSISLVAGIVFAWLEIQRKESEEKRKRENEIKRAVEAFDDSKALEDHRDLIRDWNKWEKELQDQFRDKYVTFIEKDLWDAIANKTLDEIKEGVNVLLYICERIFEDKESKPISIVKQLQEALENDARALLSMLKEYPESIGIARQIAGNFSPELKKTVLEYAKEFPNQIRDLRVELDFPDTESFPIQEQFAYHAKDHTPEEKLTAWLNAHELDCSPFADTDSPFFSFDKKLFTHLTQ